MALLFWAALVLLICGFAAMNPWTIGMAVLFGGFAIYKIDQRQQQANRDEAERAVKEKMAAGNGRPKGNVDIVVRSNGFDHGR